MRTLKGKRLWPVLALAPVFALAAFLAIGLLAANGVPSADAQGLPVDANELLPLSGAAGDECDVDVEGTTYKGKTVAGASCIASGNSLDVVFKNSGGTVASYAVYVTGGADFPDIQAIKTFGSVLATDAIGKEGLDEHRLAIPARDDFNVNGEETVSVSRSMAEGGEVYLFAYPAAADGIPLPSTATLLPDIDHGTATNKGIAVKVVFRGAPVAMDGETVRSNLTAGTITDNQEEKVITVVVQDKDGVGLNGYIALAVEGGDSVQFEDSSQIDPKTHRVRLANGAPRAGETITVVGLPKTGAVRIKVTGVFGGLTISDYITRAGDAAAVEAKAYSCVDETSETTPAMVCDNEVLALGTSTTGDDPKELTALEPGDRFIIAGKATDSAGNEVLSFKWEPADDDAKGALVNGDGANAIVSTAAADELEGSPDDTQTGLETAIVEVAADADLGTYDIKVEDTGEDAETTVSFTVAGEASMLMLSGPDVITGRLATYTVKATDAGGNIPTDVPNTATTGLRVDVDVIADAGDVDVRGVYTNGSVIFLNSGEGTFRLVIKPDVPRGANIEIILTGTGLSASKIVTYGMVNNAPTAVSSLEAITLAMGATSEAIDVSGAFSDADGDALTYTATSANTGVARVSSVAGSMVTVTAVGAGMTTITVTATDPEGASARQSIAVTVPDTSLGNPMGLSATGGTGSATVSWTPAANATVHWVWSVKRDGSEVGKYTRAAGDAGMVMVTDLTSGDYLFTVLAGQASDDGMSTAWSSWTAWAGASIR